MNSLSKSMLKITTIFQFLRFLSESKVINLNLFDSHSNSVPRSSLQKWAPTLENFTHLIRLESPQNYILWTCPEETCSQLKRQCGKLNLSVHSPHFTTSCPFLPSGHKNVKLFSTCPFCTRDEQPNEQCRSTKCPPDVNEGLSPIKSRKGQKLPETVTFIYFVSE